MQVTGDWSLDLPSLGISVSRCPLSMSSHVDDGGAGKWWWLWSMCVFKMYTDGCLFVNASQGSLSVHE